MRELKRDEETGLALVVDRSDPPRYYVSAATRVDLLAIGDTKAANAAFRTKVNEAKKRRSRRPPKQ